MERNEVFSKVQEVCREVFGNDHLVVSESTVAADVEGWDSLCILH